MDLGPFSLDQVIGQLPSPTVVGNLGGQVGKETGVGVLHLALLVAEGESVPKTGFSQNVRATVTLWFHGEPRYVWGLSSPAYYPNLPKPQFNRTPDLEEGKWTTKNAKIRNLRKRDRGQLRPWRGGKKQTSRPGSQTKNPWNDAETDLAGDRVRTTMRPWADGMLPTTTMMPLGRGCLRSSALPATLAVGDEAISQDLRLPSPRKRTLFLVRAGKPGFPLIA